MRKLLIALLATATLPAALHAQDYEMQTRDVDRPERPERVREPRVQREAAVEQAEAPSAPREIQLAADDRRERNNRPDRSQRADRPDVFQGRSDVNAGFRGRDNQPDRRRFDTPQAPPAPAAQPQQPPSNAWSRDDRTRAARDRADGNRPDFNRDGNRVGQDWNANRTDNRRDWNRSDNNRSDWNRNDNNRRDWDRNNDGRRDWNDNYRNDGRWNGNDRNTRNWDRGWRNNNRYDWQRYRSSNRNAFRLPRYYAPYNWNYGYRRFSIGASLYVGLYQRDYWIDNPWEYRLPPVYWPYQWVRYYNDALLVDTRSGYVVDVIPDIFWY